MSSLDIIRLSDQTAISVSALRRLLPDITTALFFCKAYKLSNHQVRELLPKLFPDSEVLRTLLTEASAHSQELQDFVVDLYPTEIQYGEVLPEEGQEPPSETILAELFREASVTIADNLQVLANKLMTAIDRMPGTAGRMIFRNLAHVHRARGSIGTFEARIDHSRTSRSLVILDVSGSMSKETVDAILGDVLALTKKADAHLAIVSNNAFLWKPGEATMQAVLSASEFRGTQYASLIPVLQGTWDTVITIADYDSSRDTRTAIARDCKSLKIRQLYDMSLVDRPTFLAECLEFAAEQTQPLLVCNNRY